MPVWVPGDDVIARYPDRQVLVVGDTVVGLALTALLRRGGFDPLLVGGPERPVEPRVTYLWPPAVRVLDAVGVGDPVLDRAVAPDGVSVRWDGGGTTLSGSGDVELPAVVRTGDLRQALERELPDHDAERTVDALSRQDEGLTVEFADGVGECFDAVVATAEGDGSLRRGRSPESDTWEQYETRVETDTAGDRLREGWHPDAFVQEIPHPDGRGTVRRVTTPRSDLPAVPDDGTRAGIDLTRELSGVEPTTVRQASLPRDGSERTWWGEDRVAFCGPAAWPVAPASGFRVSFGIEDALSFVSELTRERRPVSDVVDGYAARRSRRVRTLRRTAERFRDDHGYPVTSANSPLTSLGLLRTLALGPFLDPRLAALQADGFGR